MSTVEHRGAEDVLCKVLKAVRDAPVPAGFAASVRAAIERRRERRTCAQIRELPVGVGYTIGLAWDGDTFQVLHGEGADERER